MTTLLVFSDDWGRHPSSCQHLVQCLLPRYPTVWVNTIGTRVPGLDLYSVRRAFEKARSWVATAKPAEATPEAGNPRVLAPMMWPRFTTGIERHLNRFLLDRVVAEAIPDAQECIAVTTIPLVADLFQQRPVQRWVYYCVDDLSQWPGLDRKALEQMERRLVDRVDEVVAVSEELVDRMRSMGRSASLITHGIDMDHWQHGESECPVEISSIAGPRIVFWGTIDRRLNSAWIAALSRDLTQGSLIFLGPDNGSDPELWKLPNVHRVDAVPYSSLPAVAHEAEVLIMPYDDLPVTRAMQPLKFKEYLATMKPVVASRLPALESWRDACDLVSSPEQLIASVHAALRDGLTEDHRKTRSRLEMETWQQKAETFERALLGESGNA